MLSFYSVLGQASPNANLAGIPSSLLVYACAALLIACLCSLLEGVLLGSAVGHIEALALDGQRSGVIMKGIKANPERALTALVTLNTAAHTIGAAGAGAEASRLFGTVGFVGVVATLTLLMLVLSKIIPKALGWRYWRELLPFSAYALYGLVWGLTPILWALGFLTRRIARDETANVVTRSEIESIAEMSNTSGTLDASEHQILKNLLRLDEVQVSTVMTPRTVMLCFQEDITIGEVLQATEQLPYSRLPIYAQNRDDITGFVLRHEILAGAARDEHQRVLRELRREIISVPEAMSLARFIQELVEKHHHIALVVDEYGGTAGIITMEDAIESLLGVEITDETDLVTDLRLLASQRYDRQRTLLGFVMGEAASDPPIDE